MPYINGSTWLSWSDTTTSAKFDKVLPIWQGDFATLQFADVASGGATQSVEKIVSLALRDAFTSVKDARITKIHGSWQAGHNLFAGTAAVAAVPKATGVPSTVALAAIPSHLKPTALLEMGLQANNDFAYLYLQSDVGAAITTYTASEQNGMAGYPLIQVAVPYQAKDAARASLPGGNAPENVYNRTGTSVFVIDENDEMQLFGCLQNEISFSAFAEWVGLPKGSMQGMQSYALNNRPISLTGNLYGIGPYVWNDLFYGDDRGSDGWHTEIVLNAEWQPVKQKEFLFLTYSDLGRETIIQLPAAQIRATGEIPYGADATAVAFEITAKTASIYVSDWLVSSHIFAIDQSLT